MKVAVVGASGYTGAELLRLCASHPQLDVVAATAGTQAGQPVASLYPSLSAAYPGMDFAHLQPDALHGLDVVFLGLPHGRAQLLVPELVDRVGLIVDLSADFRLHDAGSYPQWYGHDHASPDLLDRFVYGLPELNRPQLTGARMVAAAGCYPTAAAVALAPLVAAGVVGITGIVVDAASGASGAGRTLAHATHFATVDEDYTAYGLLNHRHTPEIEQAVGAQVLFTPHLAPMSRGILATCYARPTSPDLDTAAVMGVLHATYDEEPFVVVTDDPPSTKATLGSNCAHVTARVDRRTGWVMVLCAIDNLVKGASGQAVQCANLALGLPEDTGLPIAGVYP